MEELEPALSTTQIMPIKELSTEEFQKTLNSWLEKQGIISDVKSYLKYKMVNVLRNTVIGNKLNRNTLQVYSFAQQALHLIVAEYLVQNRCHFTLSLFNSEVNLTNILPETKLFLSGDTDGQDVKVFNQENLVNILELIGLTRHSDKFSNIVRSYLNQNHSLLTCLVNVLSEVSCSDKCENGIKEEYSDIDDEFLQNIAKALQSSDLPRKSQQHLMQDIKLCYDLKVKTFESQCLQLVNKFKKELNLREAKMGKIQDEKRNLEKQIKTLQNEYKLLEEKNDLLRKESRTVPLEQQSESITKNCVQKHCSEECAKFKMQHLEYKQEINELRTKNVLQKNELEQFKCRCKDLLDEVNSCQSKLRIVNIKVQEDDSDVDYKDKWSPDENISFSSDSITEEIVLKAKEKLKLLEEESAQLDIKFIEFVNKNAS